MEDAQDNTKTPNSRWAVVKEAIILLLGATNPLTPCRDQLCCYCLPPPPTLVSRLKLEAMCDWTNAWPGAFQLFWGLDSVKGKLWRLQGSYLQAKRPTGLYYINWPRTDSISCLTSAPSLATFIFILQKAKIILPLFYIFFTILCLCFYFSNVVSVNWPSKTWTLQSLCVPHGRRSVSVGPAQIHFMNSPCYLLKASFLNQVLTFRMIT